MSLVMRSDNRAIMLRLRKRAFQLSLIAILVGVALISWSSRLIGPIDLRYDASTYFILGTSLAEGKGYRLLNEPGEIEATQYQPLLPLEHADQLTRFSLSEFNAHGFLPMSDQIA